MKTIQSRVLVILLLGVTAISFGQTGVDVTFRYQPPAGTPGPFYVVGEFNGWSNTQLPLTYIGNNVYERTVTLPLGGTPSGTVPGAVQYKFYYPTASSWPSDPLNPRLNASDNNNSILYVKDPTIYHFLPNQVSGIVRTSRPVISAFIFPAQGSVLDTATITLTIDTVSIVNLGAHYDSVRKQLQYPVPWDLRNGTHAAWLTAGSNSDSVTFTVQAGFAQIRNRPGFTTRRSLWTIYGTVEDTSISALRLIRNSIDSTDVSVSSGLFEVTVNLGEGVNSFIAAVTDTSGQLRVSEPYAVTRSVDHTPDADAYVVSTGSQLQFMATGSTDPDNDIAAYWWEQASGNPEPLVGFDGKTDAQLQIAKPQKPGQYVYTLLVSDSVGNIDTTRQFFILGDDGSVEASQYATIPLWARQGRMYSMFFKSMTPEGTINAAKPYLSYLQQLGVNIIWVLPVMENAFPINNGIGPGYNIKNLFKVAPEYGTNEDFRQFVAEAHTRGIRVLLDVTPNHTSFAHPFVQEGRLHVEDSPYWNFYVHRIIPHNDNGLGQSLTSDGYNYYSGFSDQLLNYDWSDVDARAFMVGVYDWWVREFDLDGYRFDVYWGPRRRANNGAGGENEMGIPTRTALRDRKADIFLLGEDDGTGFGTEVIYADQGGGVDAGYDWGLYHNGISSFGFSAPSIEALHTRLFNSGYVPGPNSRYLRFLENHDEDRIVYKYGSYEKTKPVSAAVLLAPGMPLVYSGQEVGWGLGITDYDQRRRGVIHWEAPGRPLLLGHYQRLMQARRQYRAFDTQTMVRIATTDALVYSYARPFAGEDAIVAVNMSSTSKSLTLNVPSSALGVALQDGLQYTISDIYADSLKYASALSGGVDVPVHLPPYGVFVGIVADSARSLVLPTITSVEDAGMGQEVPSRFALHQNYPNPFNPSTTFRFDLPLDMEVRLTVYNVLGQEVARVVDGRYSAGTHQTIWAAPVHLSTGIYYAQLRSGDNLAVRKLLYLR